MIETTLRDIRSLKENLTGAEDGNQLDEIARILEAAAHGEAVK